MGSRVMHYIIANQIAERFSVKDKVSFILGGISPDAVAPKDLSHFFTGEVSDYTRSIDYGGFLEKYDTAKHTSFILGYYTHLIADDIWLKGFYLPWLKNRMENDPTIFNEYHRDFQLLNGKLLNYYGVEMDILQDWEKNSSIFDLEEVKTSDISKFVPYVLGDMDYNKEDIDQKLTVFTFEQILGYVETSIDKGLLLIKPLLAKSY
jgi:hypothetical protein